MTQGAIFIHRGIWENWLWEEKPFSKGQAWIDMLLLANHKDQKVPYKGNITLIKRGEFIRSERDLSFRWGWSKSKVHAFLSLLKSDEMINILSDQKANRISVLNYDTYQTLQISKKPIEDQLKTSKRPVKDLNNNENNENNVFSENSDEFRLALYLFNHIRKRNPKHKKPDIQKWALHIDYMIRLDLRSVDEIKKVISWCQKDSFWQNNILSTSKLRNQYDQLILKMGNGNNKPDFGTCGKCGAPNIDLFDGICMECCRKGN